MVAGEEEVEREEVVMDGLVKQQEAQEEEEVELGKAQQ